MECYLMQVSIRVTHTWTERFCVALWGFGLYKHAVYVTVVDSGLEIDVWFWIQVWHSFSSQGRNVIFNLYFGANH